MNEIAITVKGKDLSDVATKMVALGQSLTGTTAEPTPKKGRGKKAAAQVEEEEIEETIEEDTDVEDLSDDEEVEETDDAEEIEEDEDVEESNDDELPKVNAKELATLKKALNSYSAKHGKDKAVKILHKYAKVSQDVLQDDLNKLLKALKV